MFERCIVYVLSIAFLQLVAVVLILGTWIEIRVGVDSSEVVLFKSTWIEIMD